MKRIALALALLVATAHLVAAQGAREVDPYYVSLRSDEVNVRAGPGRNYPIEWVYRRRNLPLQVTAEVDDWRRIKDFEGDEGWVTKSLLSTRRTVLVQGEGVQDLFEEPDDGAEVIAQLEGGVTARLVACQPDGWCVIDTVAGRGYMQAAGLWGVSGE